MFVEYHPLRIHLPEFWLWQKVHMHFDLEYTSTKHKSANIACLGRNFLLHMFC